MPSQTSWGNWGGGSPAGDPATQGQNPGAGPPFYPEGLILRKIGQTALVNGTPTIASIVTPSDGNPHIVTVASVLVVTTLEVGGLVTISFTINNLLETVTMFAAALAAGTYLNAADSIPCDPGSTVTITQASALTSGAASIIGTVISGQ